MSSDLVFHDVLITDHGQLSFGDHDSEYPEYETGEEAILTTKSLVVVSCADDEITVDVSTSDPDDLCGREVIYDGPLAVRKVEVGTFIGTDLQPLELPGGNYRLGVFVDEAGGATSLVFVCTPAP